MDELLQGELPCMEMIQSLILIRDNWQKGSFGHGLEMQDCRCQLFCAANFLVLYKNMWISCNIGIYIKIFAGIHCIVSSKNIQSATLLAHLISKTFQVDIR